MPAPPSPYTPNNAVVYLAAFNGTLAALSEAGVVNAPLIADAYAQEFDTQWGPGAFTSLELNEINSQSYNYWAGRSPPAIKTVFGVLLAFMPGTYTSIVAGIIALVVAGNSRVVAQGIDPNAGGGGGGPVDVLGVLWTSLATTHPGAATSFLPLNGRSVVGDGGEGQVFWNPTDTRATNGGTIQQVVGIVTGRWNRVLDPLKFSVKWFGAKGDGTTVDTAALRACALAAFNYQLTFTVDTRACTVGVYFPFGEYVIDDEVAFQTFTQISGDLGTMVRQTVSTKTCFRLAGEGNEVDRLQFYGGRHGIAFYGPAPAYLGGGNLGNVGAAGPIPIRMCVFTGHQGPAILQDTSQTGQQRGSTAQLLVSGCFNEAASFYFGDFQQARFEGCYVSPRDYNPVAHPQDTNGFPLGVWNTGQLLEIVGCLGAPDLETTARRCWIYGAGVIRCDNMRFGGEESCVLVRTKFTTVIEYNGSQLYPDPNDSCPQVSIERSQVSSTSGVNWLEVYDTFPSGIVVRDNILDFPNPGNLNGIPFFNTLGVWVDSGVSLSEIAMRGGMTLDLDSVFSEASPFFFRQSADPTSEAGTNLMPLLRPWLTESYATSGRRYAAQQDPNENNVFYSGTIDWTTMSGTSSGVTAGSVDTSTGYSLQGFLGNAGAGFTGSVSFLGVAGQHFGKGSGGNLPAGIYTFSWYLKADFDGEIRAIYSNGTRFTQWTRRFDGSGRWQRMWATFYHVGGALSDLGLAIDVWPNGGNAWVGLMAAHRGEVPAPWLYPVNDPNAPTQNTTVVGKVKAQYYGTASPTTGTYAVGDIVWNTTPSGGGPVGWICVTAPHTFLIIGNAGGAPAGSAGGDLNGTYPNPDVAKLSGAMPMPIYDGATLVAQVESEGGNFYGVFLGKGAAPAANSFALASDGSATTLLNVPAAGAIKVRVGNGADIVTIQSSFFQAAPSSFAQLLAPDVFLDSNTVHLRDASTAAYGSITPDGTGGAVVSGANSLTLDHLSKVTNAVTSASAGAHSTYLAITINGTPYKIDLLAVS